MIVVGVELVENFKPILLAFAGLLLYSSYNLLTKDDSEEDDEDLSDNKLVKVCRYLFFLLLVRRTLTEGFFHNDGGPMSEQALLMSCVPEFSKCMMQLISLSARQWQVKQPKICTWQYPGGGAYC